MKQIIDFPCIPFAQLPTPLYKLENLSREIGKNIYIKRDDMTGVALDGNKVRKLNSGGCQEQRGRCCPHRWQPSVQPHYAHRRLCRATGYEEHFGAEKAGRAHRRQLDSGQYFGTEVRLVDTNSYDDVYAKMDRIMEQPRAQGHAPTPFLWVARSLWAVLDTSTV